MSQVASHVSFTVDIKWWWWCVSTYSSIPLQCNTLLMILLAKQFNLNQPQLEGGGMIPTSKIVSISVISPYENSVWQTTIATNQAVTCTKLV